MPLVTFVVLFIVPAPFLAGSVPHLLRRGPISAPVPLFGGLFHIFGTLFQKLWNCSTFCTSPIIYSKIEKFSNCVWFSLAMQNEECRSTFNRTFVFALTLVIWNKYVLSCGFYPFNNSTGRLSHLYIPDLILQCIQ